MQSSPDAPNLAELKRQASVQGNIAVKALPIRLLALCTAVQEGFTGGQSRTAHLAASHNPAD